MANRKTKRTTRTTTTYSYTLPYWMLQLSFWLVVLIGAAMAIMGILHVVGLTQLDAALNYVKYVCMAIALIIPVILSYRIAWHKGTVWFVFWIIFVILIVVGIVLAAI